MVKHRKLEIIYKNNAPYGIRDNTGYLFFFRKISKFQNQEERYRKEIQQLFELADDLLKFLEERTFTDDFNYDGF